MNGDRTEAEAEAETLAGVPSRTPWSGTRARLLRRPLVLASFPGGRTAAGMITRRHCSVPGGLSQGTPFPWDLPSSGLSTAEAGWHLSDAAQEGLAEGVQRTQPRSHSTTQHVTFDSL